MRQLNACATLREHIQSLFHLDDEAIKVPLARSTYSDALANKNRLKITKASFTALYSSAIKQLPDRLVGIDGIEGRDIYTMDGTYQNESCHFNTLSSSDGGTDSSKGHLIFTVFNLRAGLPVDTDIDTSAMSEIRFVKERWNNSPLTSQKNALWDVDRGFIDSVYWDVRKYKHGVTRIIRMKSNLNYSVIEALNVTASHKNQGVKSDRLIYLNSSKEQWCLIEYKSDTGETYEYLINDLTSRPSVIAFLYHRRWDEEKYFDHYKNDLAHSKEWLD